ncbi:phosphatidate cytidylyltransferase [Rhizobium sp. RU20A]|uniref:phosphatidate cytidylyltransferase n=1 Tax=Rhizobium sp. RU20A TaxID=1907412 RepID=UPI000954FEDB|nr:phosphatidate cytidylyltransferase [Rhizobium sp. RU20A]SIQ01106.1 phosphatidate cytidylyltransferase [Rhizobium sp. RU20A]
MSQELKLRVLSGLVMAALVLAATWYGGMAFAILSVLIGLLVYFEWASMTGLGQRDPEGRALGWLAVVSTGISVLVADLETSLVTLLIFTVLAAGWAQFRGRSHWLTAGIVYSGLTAIALAAIRGESAVGLVAMLFVFAVVWSTDILAYFVGRAIGGPKLAPRISPGKTWSGAIGGAFFGIVGGVAVYLSYFASFSVRIVLLALALSCASQVGDLFESFIKRRFGVKDSSHLIPGHGGVMDRVDGLVFACFAALLLAVAQTYLYAEQARSVGALLLGR